MFSEQCSPKSRIDSSNVCISEFDLNFFWLATKMSKCFHGENFWGRPEAILELLKKFSNEENSIFEDESENEDFVEIQTHKFIDSDRDENNDLSFENNNDEEKTLIEN